jgi:brefeldin A-inhibited guanine nucleotide-exchange protein
VALDCLQKLLAHGFLRGDERIMRLMTPPADSNAESKEKEEVPLIDEVVETVCRCNNLTNDGVQLQVIKALLTAITTEHATVNEESLLLAVRSCYNIHLVSHSIVNKTTAKATLTQMLSFMFQRMETAEVDMLQTQKRKQQAAYSK